METFSFRDAGRRAKSLELKFRISINQTRQTRQGKSWFS